VRYLQPAHYCGVRSPPLIRWRVLPAAILIAGCDATAPRPNVVVTLSSSVTAINWETGSGGLPIMRCDVQFRVTASGNATAKWSHASLRYYQGAPLRIVDSTRMSATEVAESWPADSILPAETLYSDWYFTSGLPFEGELEMRYTVAASGRTDTTVTRFACGPKAGDAPPPPPVVASLAVTPSRTPLQHGDTLYVSYTASSSYGLYATKVELSGPAVVSRILAEQMSTSTTRTVAIPVPADARLGEPFAVAAVAVDGLGQEGAQGLQTGLSLVDESPPYITSAGINAFRTDFVLDKSVVVGDTMWLSVSGKDNREITWMVYEFTGAINVRDSLPWQQDVARTYSQWYVPLVARPEWTGESTVTVYVRDAAGHVSAPVSSSPGGVWVYPEVQRPLRSGPELGSNYDAVLDTKRGEIHYGHGDGNVRSISLATLQVTRTIAFGTPHNGIDMTPGGDSLVVTLPLINSFAIVDLANAALPADTIRLAHLDSAHLRVQGTPANPLTVSAAANGKLFFRLNWLLEGGGVVLEHDLNSGAQRMRPEWFASIYTYGGAEVSGDRSRVFRFHASCGQVYVAATDEVSPCKPMDLPQPASWSSADWSGSRHSSGNAVFDGSLEKIRAFEEPNVRSVLSPDGTRIYFGVPRAIIVGDVTTGRLIERIPVPTMVSAPLQIVVDPHGAFLVAMRGGATVYVDLR
jgi:hypothetical protein